MYTYTGGQYPNDWGGYYAVCTRVRVRDALPLVVIGKLMIVSRRARCIRAPLTPLCSAGEHLQRRLNAGPLANRAVSSGTRMLWREM